jgi:ketosteroid isomerase-like protein
MSQENVENLRQALDAFNRRDKATFLSMCDPDVENFPPPDWPESSPVSGAEAVWDFYVQNNDPWENSPLEYGRFIFPAEDTVAAEVRGDVQGKASGAAVPWSFWQLVTFRNGKAARISWFSDRTAALEAARSEN